MSGYGYIFRFPQDTPPLNYLGLEGVHRIGTTVRIVHRPEGRELYLYDTLIAVIGRDSVSFPITRDQHQATREWLERIVRDNGIGQSVWRHRFVLYMDGKLPVEGMTYPAYPARSSSHV